MHIETYKARHTQILEKHRASRHAPNRSRPLRQSLPLPE
jgi:hypothetical protein